MAQTDALAKQPKEKLVARVKGYLNRQAKERANAVTNTAFDAAACAGGGAVAGILDSKYPDLRGTGVPASVPAGAALVALSLSGYAGRGRNAELVAEVGKGMLAVAASRKAVEVWSKRK